MTIILLAAAAISGLTAAYSGESFADVVIILLVVLLNAVLGVFQESKAKTAIEALQQMTAATSQGAAGRQGVSLPSDELVPGDVVVLEAGDAVPADGRMHRKRQPEDRGGGADRRVACRSTKHRGR